MNSVDVREPFSSAILAFDIGGTRIKAGVIQGEKVQVLHIVPLHPEQGMQAIADQLYQIGTALRQSFVVQAIGISIKGIVDARRGMIMDVNEALSDLIGRSFSDLLALRFNLPVFMENDARMYALGELLYGVGRDATNMLCLTLGTGVGCGVVINGELLRGPRGLAGILGGHITIQVDGPLCSCGNIGCLESFIGTAALLRTVGAGRQSYPASVLHREAQVTPSHIFIAAERHDPLACQIVESFSRYLSAGVVSLIHAYDPDIVVVGGGISGAADRFLPDVQRYVDEHVWTLPGVQIPIVQAQLGDAAALIGVAVLARQQVALMQIK